MRIKGRSESATFSSEKKAEAWAKRLEAAIEDSRYFPHAATRTSFDALAEDYAKTVLPEFDETQHTARARHLEWFSKQFAGLAVAEITAERVSKARDQLAAETFRRQARVPDAIRLQVRALADAGSTHREIATAAGQSLVVVRRVLRGEGEPKAYRRTGATVNRYMATLSTVLSFAMKERRLIDRNPVGDLGRKKESRGRTRFLTDDERARLLSACAKSDLDARRSLQTPLATRTAQCRVAGPRVLGHCGLVREC